MRYDGERYGDDNDFLLTRPTLTPAQVTQVQSGLAESIRQEVTYPQITADQNNFALQSEFLFHRFTTDASRTITGLTGLGVSTKYIVNVGSQNLVLANNSASSAAENRILTDSGANITLAPNQIALIFYDGTSSRVRAK